MRALMMATGIVVAMVAGSAQAFEVDGYRSGMTFAEVQRLTITNGRQLVYPHTVGEYSTYLAVQPGDPVVPAGTIPAFKFCYGKLYSYERFVPGGFPAIVKLGDLLRGQFGEPKARFLTVPMERGEHLYAYWTWAIGDETVGVTAAAVQGGTVAATQSWSSELITCNRLRRP